MDSDILGSDQANRLNLLENHPPKQTFSALRASFSVAKTALKGASSSLGTNDSSSCSSILPPFALIPVAVGMAVTRHPPHRSRRAELPHRAPASGQTQRRDTSSRTPNCTLDAASSLCVPVTVACPEFPLAEGLFSTNSAGGWPV